MKLLKTKPEASPEVSLAERIKEARAAADAYIQGLAQKIKDEGNPVPIGVIRQMIDKNVVALGVFKYTRLG